MLGSSFRKFLLFAPYRYLSSNPDSFGSGKNWPQRKNEGIPCFEELVVFYGGREAYFATLKVFVEFLEIILWVFK